MHLDDELIQRELHRELGSRDAAVRAHLADCLECRDRLAEAAREEARVYELLRRIDHGALPIDPQALVDRARRARLAWTRSAAVVLLGLGVAGVAYATPGSPFRTWLQAVVEAVTGSRADPVAPTLPDTPSVPGPSGLSIDPGRSYVIVLLAPQDSAQLRVSLTSDPVLVVTALSGTPTFTSGTYRLTIDNRTTPTDFAITIPREAPRVEIWVGRERVFLKEGLRVTTQPGEGAGSYVVPLRGRGP